MPFRIVLDIRHIRDFGIGTYIRNLLNALAKIDSENTYLLTGARADMRELPALPPNFELSEYERSDSAPIDNIAYPLFLRQLHADLCHVPLNMAPLLMPRPYVVTIHDMSTLLFDESSGWRKQFRLYRAERTLTRADCVLAVSEATRRDVIELLNIPASRIRRIYNAPDPKFIEHARETSPAGEAAHQIEMRRVLERYQISRPFLLYAGNIRPQKNIPRLVEAFAVLRGDLESHPEYHDLRLIIIGDEISKYPAVRRAVIQTRMQNAVRFLGFVPFDTLRIFYEAAAAFVFPSLYEGFGLPPLEAMGAGTPVVTSAVSSLPEVVGDAAMIVNPDNVFDIARGIREVLLDASLRETLIRKGFEQFGKFSWDRTAREVLDTYTEVIGARARSRR
ncbi:MAG: glycosyltransferase family 1 protein [Acidobacteria bacterium]|nr:glycosyltransferase family 1 protein [Acidobacteriota bacterium]